MTRRSDPSYRVLLSVPSIGRIVLGTGLVRAANSLGGAVILGMGACVAGGILAAVLVPSRDRATEPHTR